MTNMLISTHPWIKALHIISVIAWMAGLFYLPRLFVHHVERVEQGSTTDQLFQDMERNLLRIIMNPALVAVWSFGLILMLTPGVVDWTLIWPWTKTAAVLILTWFHHWLDCRRKDFAAGRNRIPGRTYRLMNELPTLAMPVIVFSVVIRF